MSIGLDQALLAYLEIGAALLVAWGIFATLVHVSSVRDGLVPPARIRWTPFTSMSSRP